MPQTRFRMFHQPDEQPETAPRGCDHPGCAGEGLYRAPRSPRELTSYYWFCLEHVRAYNASWNYCAGLDVDEIEARLREDIVWGRPTWPLGARRPLYEHLDPETFRDDFGIFGDAHREEGRFRHAGGASNGERFRRGRRTEAPASMSPSAPAGAMAIFGLELPLTLAQIKSRYKELVKRHHPDANGGDKAAEERLKLINQAYATLKSFVLP